MRIIATETAEVANAESVLSRVKLWMGAAGVTFWLGVAAGAWGFFTKVPFGLNVQTSLAGTFALLFWFSAAMYLLAALRRQQLADRGVLLDASQEEVSDKTLSVYRMAQSRISTHRTGAQRHQELLGLERLAKHGALEGANQAYETWGLQHFARASEEARATPETSSAVI